MASKNTAAGCGTLLVVVLVVGGCSKLVDAVFGDDKAPTAVTASGPVTLPDLTKKTLVQAENEAEALGLEVSTTGLMGSYCDDETDCFVYKMAPAAGSVVRAGGKVALKFMTGEERKFYRKYQKMPNVVGWSQDRAEALFEPVYWAADSTLKESRSVPENTYRVLSQSPKAGKPLRVGQKVKLVVGFNYGSLSGGGGTDFSGGNNSGESRFCSRRWWC
ncbi:PASTA domain-containing protein [Streptosporangium sp. NPDC004631]